MEKKPTIKDVAREAGVALGTASRVVNEHANVAPGIRAKVEAAIAKLNYQPDVLARSMRSGETKTVAVLVRDIAVPLFAEFLSALEARLNIAGYSVFIASTGDDPQREIALLRLFRERKVDGIVMTTANENDQSLAQARRDLSVPVILLDRQSGAGDHCLIMGHAKGISRAAQLLLDLGHHRIALITGSQNVHPGYDRVAGYREAMSAAGCTPDSRLVSAASFRSDDARVTVERMLASANPPTALIAGSSSMLPGILQAIGSHGLRIPEDISVIAGSDSELAQFMEPAITVLKWSYAALGEDAAHVLLQDFAGEHSGPVRHHFDTRLVQRNSCGPPRS